MSPEAVAALMRNRAEAIAFVRRASPGSCLDDAEDAVQQAIVGGIARAARPNTGRWLGLSALRMLRGRRPNGRGGYVSSRSPATPIASPGAAAEDGDLLAPSDWLDLAPECATCPDLDAALDLGEVSIPPRWTPPSPSPPVQESVARLRARGWRIKDIARALGVGATTVQRWSHAGAEPSPERAAALHALVLEASRAPRPLDGGAAPVHTAAVPRLVPPPRPLAWCEAAASCLRENAVAASLGGSFADGAAEIALEGLRARVRVWPSLKISATGPQAERDRALEVLAGAGYVEGWSPGATGKMRARMPAEHEDAPARDPYLHLILEGEPPADEDPQPAADLSIKPLPRETVESRFDRLVAKSAAPTRREKAARRAVEGPADKGGDALRSALRTLRDLPPSPKPPRPAGDPAIEVLAERCYEAWRGHFGGVDPCNGIEISPWTDIHENERRAWRAVALAAATPTEDPTT